MIFSADGVKNFKYCVLVNQSSRLPLWFLIFGLVQVLVLVLVVNFLFFSSHFPIPYYLWTKFILRCVS